MVKLNTEEKAMVKLNLDLYFCHFVLIMQHLAGKMRENILMRKHAQESNGIPRIEQTPVLSFIHRLSRL